VRIGFLFNHDQIHQVAHSLPIALALAEREPETSVFVATTNDRLRMEVERLARPHGLTRIRFVDLRPRSLLSCAFVRFLNGIIPAAKLTLYRDNLEFFRSLDALVVAEKTSSILKSRYGLKDLQLIHTRHGAGDRAIGFNRASTRFDHVLVSGPKIRDRLIRETGIPASRLSMVGYPKFDLVPKVPALLPLQANGRPTILYNPHVSPHLSSWYRDGRSVLDFFLDHPEYNLIFAPHVMLFERPFVFSIDKFRVDWPGTIDAKYHAAPNIHIDLGSSASTDMTYTMAADLYLGDVSSQVYEFLLNPRPCVFINSHGIDYEDDINYAHWRTGEVICGPSELGTAIAGAWRRHGQYRSAQTSLFEQSFDLEATPSSVRAADAIMRVMRGKAAEFDIRLPVRRQVPQHAAT
jgi:hypothetical protein